MIIGDVIVADWFFYGLLLVFGLIFGVVVWWFYSTRLKIGYRAVLTERLLSDKGVPKIIARKEFKIGDAVVDVKGIPCKIDTTKPAYQDYGWTNYYFDKKSGNILTFDGTFEGVNPDDSDMFLADNLIKRFIHGIKDSPKDLLLLVVMCVVVGGMMFALGLLSSQYVLPLQNSTNVLVYTP